MIFVFVLWTSFELLSLTNGQTCSSPDSCRQLEFMPDHSFDGKRLIDHVIRTIDGILEGSCRTLCYMEPDCVSYNFKKTASENEKYKCELNNSTFEGQMRKLKTNSDYIYRGAKNACLKKPCTVKGTCQTGFTDKGYRCLCTAGFRGQHCEKAAKSCQDYFDEDKSIMSQVVTLILDSKPTSVLCHMGDFGCGDGGWTPVMKMDGNKQNFHYNKDLWSNKETFNLEGGETGFDSQETKLPTYWNTSFSKICLGMKIGQHMNFINITKKAKSLFFLIADGKYRNTSLGREKWKSLIGSDASLQRNCNMEGFNARVNYQFQSKARIVSLVTNKMTVILLTLELGLALEDIMITITHVEMRHNLKRITEINISRPWDTSWCSEKELIFIASLLMGRNKD